MSVTSFLVVDYQLHVHGRGPCGELQPQPPRSLVPALPVHCDPSSTLPAGSKFRGVYRGGGQKIFVRLSAVLQIVNADFFLLE